MHFLLKVRGYVWQLNDFVVDFKELDDAFFFFFLTQGSKHINNYF